MEVSEMLQFMKLKEGEGINEFIKLFWWIEC